MSALQYQQMRDGAIHCWPMDEPAGATSLRNVAGGTAITLSNGAVTTASNPWPGRSGGAQFDGSNDYGSAAIDLSAYSALTVEMFVRPGTYDSNDSLCMEYTPDTNSNNGFYINFDGSTGGSRPANSWYWTVGQSGATRVQYYATRPTTLVWSHVIVQFSRSTGTGWLGWMNGVQFTPSIDTNGATTGNFANSTLYFASRGGASLIWDCQLFGVAIYPNMNALTTAQAMSHYLAALRTAVVY